MSECVRVCAKQTIYRNFTACFIPVRLRLAFTLLFSVEINVKLIGSHCTRIKLSAVHLCATMHNPIAILSDWIPSSIPFRKLFWKLFVRIEFNLWRCQVFIRRWNWIWRRPFLMWASRNFFGLHDQLKSIKKSVAYEYFDAPSFEYMLDSVWNEA